jgi:drug/metabolite transporter (DMT)-like permease
MSDTSKKQAVREYRDMASIVTMGEPLTATVLAWILFHEELSRFGLLGAGFLLGAMVMILLAPKKYFEKGK